MKGCALGDKAVGARILEKPSFPVCCRGPRTLGPPNPEDWTSPEWPLPEQGILL